ncbi:hypothetical protein Tco_0002800 [Tanacetum coccineum]
MSSGFISNMLNPSPVTGIDSIFNLNTKSTSLVDVPVTAIDKPPLLSVTTTPPPPTPLITHLQQTPVPTPQLLKTLENNFLEFNQTNQFAIAVSSIPGIVDAYLANKMYESVKTAVQLQSKRLKDKAQAKNADFINKLNDNIKKIIKNQATSAPKEKTSKASGKSSEGSKSLTSLLAHQEFETGVTEDQPDEETSHIPDCGGDSSQKYTTSVTKTKAADYGHIKWIEDLVPNTMWSQVSVDYDKHALWGISHWGRRQQQFYAFAVNRESARDVYSKRRIIAVTKLEIVEWQNYKHLDWITVRRDDDKLYKFKEGDLKRLRIQDIEDMLLLLVQGKLTNLTVEERLAFNVSLRMFYKKHCHPKGCEDLQLGVESFQKKLNLTKPDIYRPDLKQREAYSTYSNPRGFIYQNKDKKNRLMRIDELHKFNDGTLNDVRTALNDHLKGIRMKYLPQTI